MLQNFCLPLVFNDSNFSFLLRKKIIFYLKDDCFTEFCFLSNLNMNQPQVYIYPFHLEPPSHPPSHPTPLGWYKAPVWVPWDIQKISIGYLLTYGIGSFHVTLSIHLTLSSPLTMSIRLFSMSVSPLLPCKQILQYHFSF